MCDAIPLVDTRMHVDVLIHRHEQFKPSSTGTLIARSVNGAACHIYQRTSPCIPAAGVPSEWLARGEEMWILHPNGGPLPTAADRGDGAQCPHILLLDGTWRQAGEMLRAVERVGRSVRLPTSAAEPSRYWLREQPAATHLSTAEALMGVFLAVGDVAAEHRFRLHFELHVYATLRARGRREMAERYLGQSPLRSEVPEVLERLHARRSRPPDEPT